MADRCVRARPRRRHVGGALLAGMATAVSTSARAQVVADGRLSITDAIVHDLASATSLIGRQMAEPFSREFGLSVLAVMFGLALVLAWPVRLWMLGRLFRLLAGAHWETRLAISTKAVGTVLVSTLLLAFAGQIALSGLTFTVRLLPETEVLAHSLAMALGVIGLGLGLGRALRSPEDKAWRPVQLPPGLGSTIGFYPFAAALTLGLTNCIDQTLRVLHATWTSWSIIQDVIMVIEACLVARFLVLAGRAREREIEAAVSTEDHPVVPAVFGLTAVVWAALAIGCIAYVVDFQRFGLLVLQELLWMGLILTIASLLTVFFDALLTQLFDEDWAVGRFATAVVGVQRARMKQTALIVGALLTVLVWLFALGLVAAPLHGDRAVVIEQIRPGVLMQSLQDLHLSPRTVITAVVVLVVGIVLTRMVRNWLEIRFLPSTSLDIGVRTSLVTGLTYTGVLIALIAATNMLGLQLDKITLIASALSVGIGFGLQSIIQNFVSGVILLIERPVKVGDWISVAGAEGTIRRIRVRATELATADGGVAIVPNSSFISANVSNRADTLMPYRLDLPLTVTGSGTATSARDTILDLVKGCSLLRDDPAPQIHLATIGDAQWVFNLRVYAIAETSLAHARSELLFWLSAQEGTDLKFKSG